MNLLKWLQRNARNGLFRLFPLILLSSLADAALLYAVRDFMKILQGTSVFWLGEWLLLTLCLVGVRWVFSFWRGIGVERASRRVESGLSVWFVRRLRTLSPRFFHSAGSDDRLMVAYDSVRVVSSSAESLMLALQAILQLVIFLPVLFYISPWLSLLVLLVVLPVVSYVQRKLHAMKPSIEGEMASRGELRSKVEGAKRFFRLWSSAEELSEISRSMFCRVRSVFSSGISVGRRKVALSQGMEALSLISVVLVLGACAWLIARGCLEPSGLVLYCSALFLCYKPVKECARLLPQLRMAKSAVGTLLELEKVPRKKMPDVHGEDSLAFCSVDFGYVPGVLVFSRKTLSVGASRPVLLQGPNGSGKSTFFKLIAGLEEADSGKVLLPKDCSSRGVFSISQDLVLPPREFMRNPDASLGSEEIGKRFLERVDGKRLWNKTGLSGGERAKVALIWSLVSPAKIVLLDEPFAFIAREERAPILSAFLDAVAFRGKWVLLATHEALPDELERRFEKLNFPLEEST